MKVSMEERLNTMKRFVCSQLVESFELKIWKEHDIATFDRLSRINLFDLVLG